MSEAIDEILRLTQGYAEARDSLAALVDEVRELQREVMAARLDPIRQAVSRASTARDVLADALEEHRAAFAGGRDAPRTRSLAGVKVGWRKRPGKLVWVDDAAVVGRIRQHLPDRAAVLVQTTERPVRGAMKSLPVSDLARIGVTLEADVDEVVIVPARDDLDAVVAALMDDAEEPS